MNIKVVNLKKLLLLLDAIYSLNGRNNGDRDIKVFPI